MIVMEVAIQAGTRESASRLWRGWAVLAVDGRSLAWRTSGACADGECVQVVCCEDGVMVRNSSAPLVTVCFTLASWRRFTAGIAAPPTSAERAAAAD
jgi:hypothetical protein